MSLRWNVAQAHLGWILCHPSHSSSDSLAHFPRLLSSVISQAIGTQRDSEDRLLAPCLRPTHLQFESAPCPPSQFSCDGERPFVRE